MSALTPDAVDDYRDLIPIKKHQLDQELEVQADLMLRISDAKVRAASRMHAAKDDLSTVEARVYMRIREGGVKYTADETSSRVQQDDRRYAAWKEFQAARQDYDRWEGLFEAWKQRGFALKVLADLFLGSYYTTISVGAADKQQRTAEHEHNRKVIARARSAVKTEGSTTKRRPLLT